ncbi:transcriptional activator RfaH [Kiloniella laminariae]|uniref:Transcriptional activator RfaH n=1 Tax=Kiloniella laminariae TaxID=454162 RepID=A0ABT4LMR2_9PROT|nr:transcriptional activator RfaH [Kiloniella laminariae]MCZ4282359.1 transcriptional activator RfaH [Kiloniella laminariae]
MKKWYVVNTQANQEIRAEINLARQGYQVFLPYFMKSRKHARKIDIVKKPLFPGYIFVALDVTIDSWSPINNTFGVRRLVANGNHLPSLPDQFVSCLKDTSNTPEHADPDLRIGTKVKFLTGPFANVIGTLSQMIDKERISILLDLLGREVTATTSRLNVTPAT